MERRGVLFLATLLWVSLWVGAANAGNFQTFFIGGRAAGMSGAYTAMSEEASVAWYNPAGLGFNRRSSLDASASAFSLQLMRVPNIFVTTLPSGTYRSDFNVSTFQVVATSLSYVFRLGGLGAPTGQAGEGDEPPAPKTTAIPQSLAISVFIPESSTFSKSLILDTQEEDVKYHQKLDVQQTYQTYYIGPSYGIRIGERLALGASLFATYSLINFRAGFNLNLAMPDGKNYFGINGGDLTVTELGLAAVIGGQYRITPELTVGLTVRSPSMRIYQSPSGYWLALAAPSEGSNEYEEVPFEGSSSGFHQSTPFRFTAGIAYVRPQQFAISADVDVFSAFKDDEMGIDYKWVVDGHVGAEIFLLKRYAITFGAFTDFAPQRSTEGFGDTRMDYIGGTLAISRLSLYDVSHCDTTNRITFSSTIGLKYAFGFGKMMGLTFDPVAAQPAVNQEVSASAHDISLIIGSSIIF